ncbi:MAG: TonB-dependent receptor [Draconibacterium sp.]
MKSILFIFAAFLPLLSFPQPKIKGVVTNGRGQAVFAANVYLKSMPQTGVTTGFNGTFELEISSSNEVLVVSFIGYETREIRLSTIDITKKITVVLKESSQTLDEVIIMAQDPISEQFSAVKMKKMDIYLDPVSQGDPLKAITVLPASTATDETANPSLRGSSPDRSRVVLNGVPVYKPVKASQLNNQGFFSLFNTEIIYRQYVYAGNPPLTYGNTSAGLVEIQTLKNLEENQLQLSASLASVGFFLSQKLKKDRSFIQVYGNYQFSDAYTGIQKAQLPHIKNFYTGDAGINLHTQIGKNWEFNSYGYYIDESFNGYSQSFTYKGNVSTLNKRGFTVNNFKRYSEKGILSISSGANKSKQVFEFGNIHSVQTTNQVYTSIDYKWHQPEKFNLQFGLSHDYHRNSFTDSIPVYYYALSPGSPSYFSDTSIHNHIVEGYLYANWDVGKKFTLSSGLRSNAPIERQEYYFSSQLSFKYRVNKKQSLILSGGKYHNYSVPTYYSKAYSLLSSCQVALDYSCELKNTLLKAAVYFKNEKGKQAVNEFFATDRINTLGLELYVEHHLFDHLKFSFSNAFIDQKMSIGGKVYPGAKDFDYFIKSTFQYNNPELFSVALTCISRPGIAYNEITASVFGNRTNFYEPIFSTDLYSSRFKGYTRFDISWSKYIRLQKSALVMFVSLNNVLNTKNERSALYNTDYSTEYFDYYQFRTIYFGLIWQLNY